MKSAIYIPNSPREAGRHIRIALAASIDRLPKSAFMQAWCSIAYLFPGLHPDGFEDGENDWPRVLRRFAAEAWRRADAGELASDVLYPSDAAWSGIYDRLDEHRRNEVERRMALAAACGPPLDV